MRPVGLPLMMGLLLAAIVVIAPSLLVVLLPTAHVQAASKINPFSPCVGLSGCYNIHMENETTKQEIEDYEQWLDTLRGLGGFTVYDPRDEK